MKANIVSNLSKRTPNRQKKKHKKKNPPPHILSNSFETLRQITINLFFLCQIFEILTKIFQNFLFFWKRNLKTNKQNKYRTIVEIRNRHSIRLSRVLNLSILSI
uniref:Transmembrane protein n=1 Tax=Cacopsylla melanoneura TaxID=428564 RepID=A0A8D9F3D2_9HEMI